MSVSVKYVGPISPVDVPLARLAGVVTGDVVQVPADVAEGLLGQEDNWVKATKADAKSDEKAGA